MEKYYQAMQKLSAKWSVIVGGFWRKQSIGVRFIGRQWGNGELVRRTGQGDGTRCRISFTGEIGEVRDGFALHALEIDVPTLCLLFFPGHVKKWPLNVIVDHCGRKHKTTENNFK